MNLALVAIVIVQFVIVWVVISIAGGGLTVLLILLGLVLAGNFANVYLLTFMLWKPLEKRWPHQPVQSDAVSRGFQTFWFGPIARYNLCLHATVDEQHIHITPMAPMRWLRARPISLPLDEMSEVRRTAIPTLMQARLGDRRIHGPAWCLSLADPDPS